MKNELIKDLSFDCHFDLFVKFTQLLFEELEKGRMIDFEGSFLISLNLKLEIDLETAKRYLTDLQELFLITVENQNSIFIQITSQGLKRCEENHEYMMWLSLEKGMSKKELVKSNDQNKVFQNLIKKGLISYDKENSIFIQKTKEFKSETQEILKYVLIFFHYTNIKIHFIQIYTQKNKKYILLSVFFLSKIQNIKKKIYFFFLFYFEYFFRFN